MNRQEETGRAPAPARAAAAPRPGPGAERRGHGRLKGEGALCSIGQILDISAGGMRVLTALKIKGELRVAFPHPEGGSLTVVCKVIWVEMVRKHCYAAGLQFVNISSEERRDLLRSRLNALARSEPFNIERLQPAWLTVNVPLIALFLGAVTLFAIATSIVRSGEILPDNIVTFAAWPIGVVLVGLGVLLMLARHGRSGGAVRTVGALDEIARLRESQSVLRSLVRSSIDGVVFARKADGSDDSDPRFEFQLVNPAAEAFLGVPAECLLGTMMGREARVLRECVIYDDAVQAWHANLPVRRELHVTASDQWVLLTVNRFAYGLLITLSDITDRRRSQTQLQRLAYNDPLTGLTNRARLRELLRDALHRSRRFAAYHVAVMYLDFDRFKVINDSLGHDVGDALLRSISARLRTHFNVPTDLDCTDTVTLARLGGDEFVILLDRMKDRDSVLNAAESLTRVLSLPHDLSGHKVVSTASVGVVMVSDAHDSPEALLRDADIAMYAAKEAGKGRWVLFDERMRGAAFDRLRLESELRSAVAAGAFELAYEPIVAVDNGRVLGVEALIRWNHPTRGRIHPADFLPIAEEVGIMSDIGQWVVRNAFEQARALNQSRTGGPGTIVSLNLSRAELLQHNLLARFERAVADSGVNPRHVCVEIPETHLAVDHQRVKELLSEFHKLGLLVALDDFGTGHSSLHAIQELEIDILKIDRTLVTADRGLFRNAAVFNAVIELARHLRLKVVAEGVERSEQMALLQSLGCEYAQGRLFGPTLEVGELSRLHAGPWPRAAAA